MPSQNEEGEVEFSSQEVIEMILSNRAKIMTMDKVLQRIINGQDVNAEVIQNLREEVAEEINEEFGVGIAPDQ
jgi:hypothetical protein